MLKLEDIKNKQIIRGLLPEADVEVKSVESNGDALSVLVKSIKDGSITEMVISRDMEEKLSVADSAFSSFDADPNDFKLAIEAKRIQWAYLFDPMMAVNSSTVQPLPHQITAVYESMLSKHPLRFLLADDPGAGKTIMAGLLIRELSMRADVQRVLIVAPGSLVDQWQDELRTKFGLYFDIFSREKERLSLGNPFEESNQWIARVDQLSRDEKLQQLLADIEWDLIVVDEAHKLSAHYSGTDIKRTKRYKLGELLGQHTRHFLLMTATPHNGHEDEFQLFLSLLDPDRFFGKATSTLRDSDLNDIMRRMVKEDMRKFDGSRLFPEREAITLDFSLSLREQELYERVTDYVRNEMNRAERIENKGKRNVVGFSLTMLQRRLASSPEAIYQSLKRRHARLNETLQEALKKGQLKSVLPESLLNSDEESDWDDLTPEEQESLDETLTQQTSAAQTVMELKKEIEILEDLERLAYIVANNDEDSKWSNLSTLLQGDVFKQLRKLIIFTEHKDTLNFLRKRISDLVGDPEAVVYICGGVDRKERLKVQEEFRNNPKVRYLIATDAAGEGVNLQNTNMMINYDLPWNPNRIEQRFGRIHRIGQTQTCHLYNLVAKGTREGDVFMRLFTKLEQQRKTLGGRVFDVLGEVFKDVPLKDLLIESIMHDGEDQQQMVLDKVDNVLEREHIEKLLDQNALCMSRFNNERIEAVRKRMDEAEARKLQPCYLRDFMCNAFKRIGGASLVEKENHRYEIKHVPQCIRNREVLTKDGHHLRWPILRNYERVTFAKDNVTQTVKGNLLQAEFLHPGHPLVLSTNAVVQETLADCIARGAILFDEKSDEEDQPKFLALVENGVKEAAGRQNYAARQLNFYYVDLQGGIKLAGAAPHLDLVPLGETDRALLAKDIEHWRRNPLAKSALIAKATVDGKALFDATLQNISSQIDRQLVQVNKRIGSVCRRMDRDCAELVDKQKKKPSQGAEGRIAKLKNQIAELIERKRIRLAELESQKQLFQVPPIIHGMALVIPKGVVLERQGTPISPVDVESRRRIEKIAMDAVMAAERALGNVVVDVSKENKGWDLESTAISDGGKTVRTRYIEVKGRAKGNDKIHVSSNEVIQGFNMRNMSYFLAYVIVDGNLHSEPRYVRTPFTQEPHFAEGGRELLISELDKRAQTAELA